MTFLHGNGVNSNNYSQEAFITLLIDKSVKSFQKPSLRGQIKEYSQAEVQNIKVLDHSIDT